MTPKTTISHSGKVYHLDEQCSSLRATTALESAIRRVSADHHAKTLFSAAEGFYGGTTEDFYNRFVERGLDTVYGWPEVGPGIVSKFRRTVVGLATVFQFGCIEMRSHGEDAYENSLAIVESMTDSQRADLYMQMTIAGGKHLAKNSGGPDQATDLQAGLPTSGDAFESLQQMDTTGSPSSEPAISK